MLFQPCSTPFISAVCYSRGQQASGPPRRSCLSAAVQRRHMEDEHRPVPVGADRTECIPTGYHTPARCLRLRSEGSLSYSCQVFGHRQPPVISPVNRINTPGGRTRKELPLRDPNIVGFSPSQSWLLNHIVAPATATAKPKPPEQGHPGTGLGRVSARLSPLCIADRASDRPTVPI